MGTTTVNITAAQVKELREKTNAPMMDCKNALAEAKGDIEAAIVVLRKKGVATAAKKATRANSEGSVASYIRARGKIDVLPEDNCESDFVAARMTSKACCTTSRCISRQLIRGSSARKT